MGSANPVRVLHVLGGLDRGGAETWLMHVLRHTDRSRYRVDFLVHTDRPCAYDEEARALGASVLPCLAPGRPLRYGRRLRQLLQEKGPYRAVHSHVHHFSGYVLRVARSAGVPVRAAHSHLDTSASDAGAPVLRKGYLALMKRWIEHHATLKLAASRQAAAALYGRDWDQEGGARLLYCGVDLAPFRHQPPREQVRAELGIPAGSLVVGHVGRFSEQKNHRFLLDVFKEVHKTRPEARLLLLGEGELRPEIERRAAAAGLAAQVHFAGSRPDVPQLLSAAVDVFVLPSLYEGLPLVGIEAQAAGLPVLLSDTITPEVDIVPGLVNRLSLSCPAATWAEAVARLGRQGRRVGALGVVEQSPFNIRFGVQALEQAYAA